MRPNLALPACHRTVVDTLAVLAEADTEGAMAPAQLLLVVLLLVAVDARSTLPTFVAHHIRFPS